MKIFIGSDHRGVDFKAKIIQILQEEGYDVENCGTNSEESCDYPRIASKVGHAVVHTSDARGILLCMSGIGQAIAANKVRGIRAALCYNSEAAKLSRQHNDANVLVLSAKFTPENELKNILNVWLTTAFEGGRHQRRVDLIGDLEDGKEL